MSDLPKSIEIHEEGPREGFQIEAGPIATARKIELIDALGETGLRAIQMVSFVSPKRVPGWADADAVVAGFHPRAGIDYTGIWLNEQGLERALAHRARLTLQGGISLTASEAFLRRNQNRDFAANIRSQHIQLETFRRHAIPVDSVFIMAAFGCNFEGDIPPARVLGLIEQALSIATEHGLALARLSLGDTMAWATPASVKRLVGLVRERWPKLRITLHLHDTRGLGIANAYAGLEMGVDSFDSAVAGLGGCPFAGHAGAAGNVCTEDLVFLCEEMGIATGIDLDRLIAVARLAEDIVGHPLPGSVMRGGSLRGYRGLPSA
jgi:hydroxymethylglutaryl-CoA lyase